MTAAEVDLKTQRHFGEMAGLAVGICRRHALVLLSIALINPLFSVLQMSLDAFTPGLPSLGSSIQAFVVGPYVIAALVVAINDAVTGSIPATWRSLSVARSRFVGVVTSDLLATALMLVSLVGIPYFFVRWIFVPQAVMIEGKRNWAALDASSSLVRGSWWRVCGVLLVLYCFVTVAIVWMAISVITGAEWLRNPGLRLGWQVVAAFLLPFIVAVETLLYYDLRVRHGAAEPAMRLEWSDA